MTWTSSPPRHEDSGRSKRFRAASTCWISTTGPCHAKQRSPREMATHCDGMATRSSCYACSGVKSETAWSSFLDLNVPGVDFTTRISTTVIRIERIRVPLDRGI